MRSGFGLIEVLIAMVISSFIMLGLVQSYRNALRLRAGSQNLLVINRRIALFFNQIERDITSGVIYEKPEAYPPQVKKRQPQPPAPPQKEKEEAPVPSITMEVEDEGFVHRAKRWKMMKTFSVLCTNPLQVFGKELMRLIRVQYALLPEKDTPQASYRIVRRQTSELKNTELKQPKDGPETVSEHTVIERVKAFGISAAYYEKKEKEEGGQNSTEKEELKTTFVWGEKQMKESRTPLPEYLSLHIELWDDAFAKTSVFECLVPFVVRALSTKPQKQEGEQGTHPQAPRQPLQARQGVR